MLARAQRLHPSALKERPSKRGRFLFGTLAYFTNYKGHAVIVSKKVCRRAVDRNRLKRRVRHALYGLSAPNYGVAIYPTKEALTVPYEELRSALEEALRTR